MKRQALLVGVGVSLLLLGLALARQLPADGPEVSYPEGPRGSYSRLSLQDLLNQEVMIYLERTDAVYGRVTRVGPNHILLEGGGIWHSGNDMEVSRVLVNTDKIVYIAFGMKRGLR